MCYTEQSYLKQITWKLELAKPEKALFNSSSIFLTKFLKRSQLQFKFRLVINLF
jgi:hypothetical protein